MASRYAAPVAALDAIYDRHSVRDFAADHIDPATINQLLSAAVHAPTAMHQEPWSFVVIQDAALMKRISDESKEIFASDLERTGAAHGVFSDALKNPDFNLFYNASTLIVICADLEGGHFVEADCWLAAENLMLAACALGLGTCLIGSAIAGLNTTQLKHDLGIPPHTDVIAPIIVGVPKDGSLRTPRKLPQLLAWW